jgi:hypothetical protein
MRVAGRAYGKTGMGRCGRMIEPAVAAPIS